jgi:hypothetical protein
MYDVRGTMYEMLKRRKLFLIFEFRLLQFATLQIVQICYISNQKSKTQNLK